MCVSNINNNALRHGCQSENCITGNSIKYHFVSVLGTKCIMKGCRIKDKMVETTGLSCLVYKLL